MPHCNNARIVGVASSVLHPLPLPLLSSLNGSSGIRNAIVSSATTSNNNNNETVARGIINHNNPDSKPNQEKHETRRNGQQQLQSHVLINSKTGIIDFQNVNSLSQSKRLQASHIKEDRDNNDQVRYNRCSSPPSQSLKDKSSLYVGLSFLNAKPSGTLDSQKLDSFLDWYEQKFDLEPLDINEVHGLSGKFEIASLLIPPPQQPGRNLDEQPEEWHKRSVQTFPEKVSQTQMMQSQSHLCSSDLSRLLAATLSDDDIQDKNAKNNNGKDSLSISCKREPLSIIKEESDSEDLSNAAKAPIKSADSFQETPTMQNGIKDSTPCTKPVSVTIINRNSVNDSNAEVDTRKVISDVTAINKISNDVSSTPPQQQKPQHIDNSKKDNTIGGHEKGNTVETKMLENSAAAPKSSIKLLFTSSSQSQPPASLTSTDATQHDHRPAPRKSRIPVPLQKTKAKSSTTQEVTATSTTTTYSLKRCDHDRNIEKSSQGVEQKQVHRSPTSAEKVLLNKKVNKESKNNFLSQKKEKILPRSTTPLPVGRTEKVKFFRRNSDSKIRPLKALTSPAKRNIGQGDEIASCLSLIDGLSGHTSWVMNKLLECPLPNENIVKRIKRLKESADIGDFFGVPYVSKQILNHSAFK